MPAIRGITVSVNYGPLLRVTLPLNMRHLTECLVVTSIDDHETQDVACSVPGVSVFETTAFFEHGARFNKGYAMELGLRQMGNKGWRLIWDSDCLFPDEMPLDKLRPNALHGCRRRILEDPTKWRPDFDWRTLPVSKDNGPIGFFQAFRADDPALQGKPWWYDVSFTHCGGGDAAFIEHWNPGNRIVLPFDVLHIGKTDCNWFGVDQAGQDMMARFVRENGWHAAAKKHSMESARRAPEIVERVQVPGYPVSTYQLPFVRRAQRMRDQRMRDQKP